MKKIHVAALSVLFLSFAGCADKSIIETSGYELVETVFAAVIESSDSCAGSKTMLGGKPSDSERKVLWLPSDEICVGAGVSSSKFTNDEPETASYASFSGLTYVSSLYYAAYPYSMVKSFGSDTFTFDLPYTQYYYKDGVGNGSFPMVAQCSDGVFHFKNMCGILVLNLVGSDEIVSITFTGRDAKGNDMPVSGRFTVPMTYSDVPVLHSGSASTTVRLDCRNSFGRGIKLSNAATPFHLVLPPGDYASFQLCLSTFEGKLMLVNSSKPLTVARSSRTTTASLTYSGEFKPEYVDLGLSVKWATFNVGASMPEDYGGKYAWGEQEQKSSSSWSNYKYCNGSSSTLTKYCTSMSYGYSKFVDMVTVLDLSDDVAHVSWGGKWRMPTREEYQELIDKCQTVESTIGNHSGKLYISKINGDTIFMPKVNYWTSSCEISYPYCGYYIYSSGSIGTDDRYEQYYVRPVWDDAVGETGVVLVDLGLSVKWATCNVGATAPEEYGDYFAWGETSSKSNYSWSTYKYCKGSSSTLTKYCNNSSYGYNGFTDSKTVLDLEDDAARANWGGSWRMPTEAEQDELRDSSNCTWTWTTMNGVNGYKVVSKKSGYAGNWIFLPAAGLRSVTYLGDVGSYGYYWSSSLYTSSPYFAYGLYFDSSDVYWGNSSRDFGQSVRLVCPVPATGIGLDRQSVEIMEGGTETLTANVQLENGTTVNTATWSSSNTGVATVDQTGKITAISAGTCTITASSGKFTVTCSVTVKSDTHQYVDLGLSVKWATCNVGAKKPEEYGDYFAWGETSSKSGYSWSTYKYCKGSSSTLTKYCYNSSYGYKGFTDSKTVLDPEDDAARANWGGSWRMPTKAEQDELRNTDNCTWTWTTLNGVNGYKVVSKKSGYAGNWIFLPAAGFRYDTYLYDVGSDGDYWSSSLYTDIPNFAYSLNFNSSLVDWNDYYRYRGQSVRPVCPVPATGIGLDRQSVEIMQGGTETLTANVQLENGVTVNTATWSSSNTSVATVDQTGKITTVSAGTCTITASSGKFTVTCSVTVNSSPYQHVDLGLSVKWATCNVGAEKPEEYGDYFAWGEISPKSDYSWSTYKYCKGSSLTLTKYCNNSSYGYNGFTDSKTVLDPADDAARANWGGSWRMPTSDDWAELRNTGNCTWTWTTLNGVSGYKVVSKKSGYAGNWIFLPAAGFRYDTNLDYVGSGGGYWSSSLYASDPYFAYYLYFFSSNVDWYYDGRYNGQSVRPVCPVPATGIGLDRQSVEIMEGGTETLTANVQLENGTTVNTATWTSSNTSVATVDQTGKITAISAGTCNINASSGSFTATCSVTVKSDTHQYVDLGLSVKWATCNIGAESPEEYGDYFAWGETKPKSYYNWSTYKYCKADYGNLTKYCTDSYYGYNGYTDNKTVLDLEDDAAHVNWGGSWRMPTRAEQDELLNTSNCTWTWTTMNGVIGYKVVSKKSGYAGNWIFLPAAGYHDDTILYRVGSYGLYWSRSLDSSDQYFAYYLFFSSGGVICSSISRYWGLSVRPVCQ